MKDEVALLKAKYEKFFEAIGMSVAIIEYNPHLIVTKVNEYFLDLMGLEPSDVLGKKLDEMLPEAKENPQWFKRFVDDLNKGIIRKKVTHYAFKNREAYLDEVYIPIKDEKDQMTEVICFGIDITKIKVKENKEKQ